VRAAAEAANGTYYIFPTRLGVIAPVALDVPGGQTANNVKIQLFHFHGGPNQRWVVTRKATDRLGRSLYTVVNLHSRKALDVPNGAAESGTLLQQFTLHDPPRPNQLWLLDDARRAPGNPLIRFVHNPGAQLAMDVPNGAPASGVRVQLFSPPHGDWSQSWVLIKVA
jgi:5-hydroxyisourate hydrolase-like protein (transthyretin family)